MSAKVSSLGPLDPLRRYSVAAALEYLDESRKTFYADVAAGRIKTIKEGRRRYVPGSEIVRRSQAPVQS